MKKIIIFLFIEFFTINYSIFAQQNKIYFDAHLFVGYAFNSGFVYGLETTIGFKQIIPEPNSINLIISSKISFLNFKLAENRVITAGVGIENDFVHFDLSMVELTRKSGFKNINRYKAYGPMISIAFHPYPHNYVPMLSSYAFVPLINNDWFEKTGIGSFYIYFPNNRLYLN